MKFTTMYGQKEKIRLSKIALGTANFGTDLDRETSYELLDYYVKMGGNVIDTARCYAEWIEGGDSASEKMIGDWIEERGNREEIVLMTKGGNPAMEDRSTTRLNEQEIRKDLDKSLHCLKTQCIDVYFLHRDDVNTPVEKIIDAMDIFRKEGKIKAFGVSNWKANRIVQANEYANQNGKISISISQIQWSYAYCTPSMFGDDTLVCMDSCEYESYRKMNMPVMGYSSQSRGILLSYIKNGEEHIPISLERFKCIENRNKGEHLKELIAETGYTAEELSLAYITNNELEGIAIIGMSKLEQLQRNLKCVDVEVECNRF